MNYGVPTKSMEFKFMSRHMKTYDDTILFTEAGSSGTGAGVETQLMRRILEPWLNLVSKWHSTSIQVVELNTSMDIWCEMLSKQLQVETAVNGIFLCLALIQNLML